MSDVHVVPNGDLIEHDLDDDCLCGPRQETVPGGGWIVIHHSLDGRERRQVAALTVAPLSAAMAPLIRVFVDIKPAAERLRLALKQLQSLARRARNPLAIDGHAYRRRTRRRRRP